MSKTLVIVNPVAGAGRTAKLWPQIKDRLHQLGLTFDAAMSEHAGHSIALARDGVRAGYDLLVAVGGDGTLHEVINGTMDRQSGTALGATIGVIAMGTGADFVRTLGLPRTWHEACTHLVGDATRLVDVGEMVYIGPTGEERRYFINVAGLGFDGEVAQRTNRSSKAIGGTVPYLSNLVLTLVNYCNKDAEVYFDDQRRPGRMNSVIVANGAWFGGGMFIAPDARPDDGLFDVVIIGDTNKLEVLQTMPRLYKGTHVTHPKISIYRASTVRVTAQQDMWIQADGEGLGRAPVAFRVLPKAVRLKV